MTIAAAVVVYNVSCADSPTCQALEQLSDITVLICDNSTGDYGNQQYCQNRGWVYLGGTGNLGISKAYNLCIDYLKTGKQADMLCLFDDDTRLDSSYFQLLRQACASSSCKIFVPLIRANGTLISPCILKPGHKVIPFPDQQAALSYSGNELSAINSCMALDLSLFDDFRYDETIFLDGVDHYFMERMRSQGESVCVFPYLCDHAFSGTEKPPVNSAKTRFRIYSRDYRYILRDDPMAYIRLVGKRALRLCIQYKTLAFLGIFFKKA